jgi:hypothetical protein
MFRDEETDMLLTTHLDLQWLEVLAPACRFGSAEEGTVSIDLLMRRRPGILQLCSWERRAAHSGQRQESGPQEIVRPRGDGTADRYRANAAERLLCDSRRAT